MAFIGLLPIILWELFSVVYFGFLFPNARYAKVGVYTFSNGVSQGVFYIIDFIFYETFPAIVTIMCALLLVINYKKIQIELFILGIGAVCQLMYVVYIGGDFMRGRFLLSSFFVIILISSIVISNKFTINSINDRSFTRSYYLYHFKKIQHYILKGHVICNIKRIVCSTKYESERKQLVALSIITYFIFLGTLSNVRQSIPGIVPSGFHGIVHERNFYFKATGLINRIKNNRLHPWYEQGLILRDRAKTEKFTLLVGPMGMLGYYAGINVTIIDNVGLTDSFIAHCPVNKRRIYRIDHAHPDVPQEYFDERIDGNVSLVWEDEELHQMYNELNTITTGKVFSLKRFETIFNFWLKHGL